MTSVFALCEIDGFRLHAELMKVYIERDNLQWLLAIAQCDIKTESAKTSVSSKPGTHLIYLHVSGVDPGESDQVC